MKIEYHIYKKMSDGFEDLLWNDNNLFSYIKWMYKTKGRKDRTISILIRGLWKPKHLTAIQIKTF